MFASISSIDHVSEHIAGGNFTPHNSRSTRCVLSTPITHSQVVSVPSKHWNDEVVCFLSQSKRLNCRCGRFVTAKLHVEKCGLHLALGTRTFLALVKRRLCNKNVRVSTQCLIQQPSSCNSINSRDKPEIIALSLLPHD